MYIRLSKSKTNKKTKVYLVEGYRDKFQCVKQRTVKCYGDLEDLVKEDPNILEKLREEAKMLSDKKITFQLNTDLKNGETGHFSNYGYLFLEGIFYSLNLHVFFRKINKKYKLSYDLTDVFKFLIFSKVVMPKEELSTILKRNLFFEKIEITIDQIYESLSIMSKIKDDLLVFLHKQLVKNLKRNRRLVYLDVTDYFLKRDVPETPTDKTMKLLLDRNGIPIYYDFYEPSFYEEKQLTKFIHKLRNKFSFDKIIFITHKLQPDLDATEFFQKYADGYMMNQNIEDTDFVNLALEEQRYKYNTSHTLKIKDFIRKMTSPDNEVEKKEKVVIFWDKFLNIKTIQKKNKLKQMIDFFKTSPLLYNDSEEKPKLEVIHNELNYMDFLSKNYQLANYHCIITSESKLQNFELLEQYRNIYQIDEYFNLNEIDLYSIPANVTESDLIDSHFLITFLALTFLKVLEAKVNHQYTIKEIQESLSQAYCDPIMKDMYKLMPQDDIFKALEKAFDTYIDLSFASFEDIRRFKNSLTQMEDEK